MNIERFHRFLDRIEVKLSKEQKSEKAVKIAEASHFTECYSTKLTLMDCVEYEISIADYNGIKTGILFCELERLQEKAFNPSLYTPLAYDFFREQIRVQEFWFVFVEETSKTAFKKYITFIEKHHLNDAYNKIFLFNFYESTIHQLK